MIWSLITGDALAVLAEMPGESVQCCVTSPPYFGLRDYGTEGQIGLESTPDEYVARLVQVFREVRRVLRADGTLWLNIGDSYANDAKWGGSSGGKHVTALHGDTGIGRGRRFTGLKSKDLIGVPWLLAFALRADGWYLRSEIIWAKPNPMPESVTDRPTSAHEHLFLLSKSARYFYDAEAIREEALDVGRENGRNGREEDVGARPPGSNPRTLARLDYTERGRNKRNVWEIATQPYPEAHFATFPLKLVEPCILVGSSPKACGQCGAPWERLTEREDTGWDGSRYGERAVEASGGAITGGTARSTLGSSNGKLVGTQRTVGWQPTCDHDDDTGRCVVLDPFAGSGTTGVVALRHGRSFTGIELNPAYVEMARRRIRDDAPLLNTPLEHVA